MAICSAHTSSGRPCRASAIAGARVCYVHGGAAPQVRRAAELRLLEMVDPALARLRVLLDNGESDAVKLAAVKDVLDRAGYARKEKHEVEHSGGVTVYLPERKA